MSSHSRSSSSSSSSSSSHSQSVHKSASPAKEPSHSQTKIPDKEKAPEAMALEVKEPVTPTPKIERMVYVSSLDVSISNEQLAKQLRELFQTKCDIVSLEVQKCRSGKYSHAFVEVKLPQQVQILIDQFHYYQLGSSRIVVAKKRPNVFERKPYAESKCYACGKIGHFARNCTHNQRHSPEKHTKSKSKSKRHNSPIKNEKASKAKKHKRPRDASMESRERHTKNRKRHERSRNREIAKKKQKQYYSEQSSVFTSSDSESSSSSSSESHHKHRKRQSKRKDKRDKRSKRNKHDKHKHSKKKDKQKKRDYSSSSS